MNNEHRHRPHNVLCHFTNVRLNNSTLLFHIQKHIRRDCVRQQWKPIQITIDEQQHDQFQWDSGECYSKMHLPTVTIVLHHHMRLAFVWLLFESIQMLIRLKRIIQFRIIRFQWLSIFFYGFFFSSSYILHSVFRIQIKLNQNYDINSEFMDHSCTK